MLSYDIFTFSNIYETQNDVIGVEFKKIINNYQTI